VRVDTVFRFRARYSKAKQYSDISESKGSNWYAPGLGIVKTAFEQPAQQAGLPRVQYVETLVTLDAGSEGLGFVESSLQTAPASSNIAGANLGLPVDAVAFNDYAVVATSLTEFGVQRGVVLSQVDTRGRVVASTAYNNADFADANLSLGARLLKTADGLKLVFPSAFGIRMLSFDATGQRLLGPQPATLVTGPIYQNGDASLFQAASSGNAVWLSWLSYPVSTNDGRSESKLNLAKFSLAGAPQGTALTLESAVNPFSVIYLKVASGADTAALAWTLLAPSGKRQRIVIVNAAGSLEDRLLPPASGSFACEFGLQPQLLNAGAPAYFICSGSPQYFGLLSVDSARNPVLDGTGNIQFNTIFPSDWLARLQGTPNFAQDADRLTFAVSMYSQFWLEDPRESAFIQVGDLSPVAGSIQATSARLLAKFPNSMIQATAYLPMGNRILVVGSDCGCQSGVMKTMVVWR
jgi:hypothetical protein